MLKITIDDADLQRNLRQLADKDARMAAVWALNDTAADVLEHVHANMDRVFDRPTRFTKGAFRIKRARPQDLEAEVVERDRQGRRHYLKVQELGGQRPQTGLEALLSSRVAYAGIIQSVTPAPGARLDAYGNWSIGERNQALSAIQAQRDPTTNTTVASRRRNRRRAGFFVPREGSGLSPGIWKRAPDGTISKVLHFSALAPVYSQRLGFQDGAAEVYQDRLPGHLARTLARMVQRVADRG
ncbi:hypothetical protein [Paracoccus sp. ME4]|uniref:hypothetical protein n=1 Tax=Paracoccus sp. ME4 TaxID=3138066 RepID=UPI00398A79C6